MAVFFSKEFGINKDAMANSGTFDALLDEDSHFFINLKRLKATAVPEFAQSYQRINNYFGNIGILLKAAKPNDKNYRTALKWFHFPEVNGINIGFSEGKRGAGFGDTLRDKIIKDAYEIIQSGSDQPEIFHLTGLFEENVGPDRLSDMIAKIILDDIRTYSRRVYLELGITPEAFPKLTFRDGIPKNPYKKHPILLLPIDILHELPIAKDWDDIDRVCRENEVIRNEMNALVGKEWRKWASSQKKKYVRDSIFKNPERLKRVIDSYRSSTPTPFNIYSDVDYLISTMLNDMVFSPTTENSSFEAAHYLLRLYKEWVEQHRGMIVLDESNSRNAEKTAQRTIHATAFAYCREHNWDISPEVDSGRGPVDFKISRGNDKTVIEIKLTSNSDCVHGYASQIEEYAKSENTTNKIFVLIDNGKNSGRIGAVEKKRKEMLEKGFHPSDLVIIDAKPKKPASQRQSP